MSRLTYLEQLDLQLAAGAGGLPAARLSSVRTFLTVNQRPDGGFAGREGESDLYYTGFGLRGLKICGGLTSTVSERAASFIRQHILQPRSIIDMLSLAYAIREARSAGGFAARALTTGWQHRLAKELETHRSPDGGYAKTDGAAIGSTYHTFLAALVWEMIEQPMPASERAMEFLLSRRRDDGGFVELPVMKRSAVNPTAAAAGLLLLLGNTSPELSEGIAECLLRFQSPTEGGFCANRALPVADLLSTFTALLTLRDLGAFERVNQGRAREFVESMATASGGFRAGIWDDQVDVEYTFYGLGSLALLAEKGDGLME